MNLSRPAPGAEPLEPRRLLAQPTAGSDPSNLLDVGGTLFFRANDAEHGFELWKSDGTANGTVLVKDIVPGQTGSSPAGFVEFNVALFFLVTDPSSHHLQLWTSDGTSAGTTLVRDLSGLANVTQFSGIVAADDALYVTGDDGAQSSALFRSDGTGAGTELVKTFTGTPLATAVRGLFAFGTIAYLSAPDAVHGRELWTSDGTEAGTVLVKDINPGNASSNPGGFVGSFAVIGGALCFAAAGPGGRGLWKTDGTEAGTVLVRDINPGGDADPAQFRVIGSTLYFAADDGANGRELWKSNGTAAGTVLLKDINPGAADSRPTGLFNHNGMLFFSAADGTHGVEPWKSNGTTAGTVMVADVDPGASGSVPRAFASLGANVYFSATDGNRSDDPPGSGFEYFSTDGTSAGTVLLKDINPGPEDASLGFVPEIVVANGAIFFQANDGVHGIELWTSDGTEVGTRLVRDISLEPPPFPFTGFSDESQVWQVLGSQLDDLVEVTLAEGKLIATRNGKVETRDAIDVSTIQVAGNDGNDRIILSSLSVAIAIRIMGGDGDDTIYGSAGNDTIAGDAGSDRVLAGAGADRILGGAERDFLYGETGYDTIFAGDGHDLIDGGDGKDRINGEAGKDRIFGGPSNDQLEGGDGNDTLFGDAGDDKLFGWYGNDTIDAGPGHDYIDAGRDHDLIIANDNARDTVFAGGGRDSGEVDAALDLLDGLETIL